MQPNYRTIRRVEIDQMEKPYRRTLINCLSGFKSLCLCGTLDSQGNTNLSLISSVIHVGANPPLMGMLIRPAVVPRHTLTNLESVGYFTLNHVRESFLPQAHQTSARYPKEVSEFDAAGLTPAYSPAQPAPYVAESYVRIGLEFREKHTLATNGTHLVVGEIVELMLPEQAVDEAGYLDLSLTETLTVAGLDSYFSAQPLTRLPYARAEKKP